MIFSNKHIIASVIGASSTPLSIARQVVAVVDLAHKDSIKASSSDRVAVSSRSGAECSIIASSTFRARVKEANTDMGILGGCAEYEKCVRDASSSLGGRCIVLGAEEGVTKAHRDLASACSGAYPNECITCKMADGITPGKKCDGENACDGIDTTLISCGSCNSPYACNGAQGPIGESSCNSDGACFNAAGPVEIHRATGIALVPDKNVS
jgi:hypothetical protein